VGSSPAVSKHSIGRTFHCSYSLQRQWNCWWILV